MRNDEVSFESLGRNPIRMKVVVVALGSGMAGLAGALYAHFYQYLTPEQFGIFYTAVILTMVVVGGVAGRGLAGPSARRSRLLSPPAAA